MRRLGQAEFHFVNDGKVIHEDSDRLDLVSWKEGVLQGEKESAIKSRKVKESIAYKLSLGQYPGLSPTGYKNTIKVSDDGEIIGKKIKVDKERAPLIKEAFELYATDNYSVAELTRIMQEKGLTIRPQKRKKPRLVGKNKMLAILKTRTYTGEFEWAGKIYKATNYEPIVPKELWEKVQKVLSKRAIRYASNHVSTAKFFKYRGLLTCAYCGCTMTPMDLSSNYKNVNPGDPGSVYYRCTYMKKSVDPDWYLKEFGTDHSGFSKRKQKISKGKYSDKRVNIVNCPQLYWKEEEVDVYLRGYLRALVYDKDVVNRIREELRVDYEETMTAAEAQRKAFEVELKKKQALMKGLVRKLGLEEYADLAMEFHEEITDVKTEIEDLRAQIESLDDMSEEHLDEIMDALILCSDIGEKFDKLDAMGQRRLVMLAFKKITLRKGRVEDINVKEGYVDVFWTDPFNELHDKWFLQVCKEIQEKQKRAREASIKSTGGDLNKSTLAVRRA
jgi:hypothetical protein